MLIVYSPIWIALVYHGDICNIFFIYTSSIQ